MGEDLDQRCHDLFPSGDLLMKDVVSKVFSCEKPDFGMRVLMGDAG